MALVVRADVDWNLQNLLEKALRAAAKLLRIRGLVEASFHDLDVGVAHPDRLGSLRSDLGLYFLYELLHRAEL